MKYIITFLVAALALASNAQTEQKIGKYAAVSYSFGAGSKINQASYGSAELGVTKENASFGVAVGRSSFDPDLKNQLFVEPKTSVTLVQAGIARGYATMGAGFWPGTNDFFIEYGAGVLFSAKDAQDIAVQWSNWAGGNYISVGYVWNFN
jgi:hypothetical protein